MRHTGGGPARPVGGGDAETTDWAEPPVRGYCHQALHYRGQDDLVDALVPFVRHGLERGDAMLVLLRAPKLDALALALGPAADAVELADIEVVGANPARIIPAWASFAERHSGRRLRGVGEPVDMASSDDVLTESVYHEDLLNVAFDPDVPLWLVCPYDVTSLSPTLVRTSMANHPFTYGPGGHRASDAYLGPHALGRPASSPLPSPPPNAHRISVDRGASLAALRRRLRAIATALGLGERADDVVLAADEVVANSLCHGGGAADLAIWGDQDAVRCDVADGGVFGDPLAGRRIPSPGEPTGRGLWIANHLCDLVQVRAIRSGTVVRLTWRRNG